jgi:uncharacterized protein YhdP
MSRARRIWKWTAIVTGSVLVLLAVAVGVFRIWLENSPQLPAEVVLRVERLTGLRFAFATLDARLGLRGPELVFRQARITVPGQQDELVTAAAGRVGLDVWRSLRTGRLAAGRLVLDGARLHVIVTADGVELRGQGDLASASGGAHLAVRDLPIGWVEIDDSTVTVEDQRTGAKPWNIDRVTLELERDPSSLTVRATVRLPDALGARLELDGHFEGDLAKPAELAWHAGVGLTRASLAGWTRLVPQWPWLPTQGSGELTLSADGRGTELGHAAARLALKHVVGATPPGASPATLAELAGVLEVRHAGGHWSASGRGLTVDPGANAWRDGEFTATLELDEAGLKGLKLSSPSIRLDPLATLATLLPDGGAREALAALAPHGALTGVDLALGRGTRPSEWRLDGGLRFTGLAVGAWRGAPGLAGLDGELRADGDHGRLRAHSQSFTLDLPRILRTPVGADEVGATLDWWWQPDGWRFAVDDAKSRSADGGGGGKARLWLPADDSSPLLVLDLSLHDIDARAAAKYLPGRVIPPAAMAWLDHAFLAGRVDNVHFEFAGPTREFPFRDGGGLFRIRVPFSGMRIHYQDGFTDIEEAEGEAEFKNQGFTAHAVRARVGGLEISDADARMADFASAELSTSARARGDLGAGLAFLKASPIGPKLGSYFMALEARGPLTAEVSLDLPFLRFAERHINLSARLEQAAATLPGIPGEATAISGAFTLRDRELEAKELSATLLGNAVRLSARTIAGPSGVPGDRVLVVDAQGRAGGEELQKLLHITRGHWFEGTSDWRAQARVPRYEWWPAPAPLPADAPPDATPAPHEVEVRWLAASVRVESALQGLAISLPAPLAKAAEEARGLRLEATIDPGLEAAAPALPASFRRGPPPHEPVLTARLQLGHDAGVAEFRYDGEYQLRRGTLRFGGGTPLLRETGGLWLEGRLAAYDLSAWLAVRLSDDTGGSVGSYLRGGTVGVDRFDIFGFLFADVTIALEAGKGEWRARVDGPAAKGTIVVPWEMPGAAPLTLDLDRLLLGERVAAGAAPAQPTDPTELPALAITIRDLEIQKRHFGTLEAKVSRTEDGLQLDSATLAGASFHAAARGSWEVTASGQRTLLSVTIESTDVQDTLSAWGFEQTLSGKSGKVSGEVRWPGGIEGDVLSRLSGNAQISVESGQLMTVTPGAGRVLGLLSVAALPRRLMLDFSDLTDKGFAFDSVKGDFEFRDGNAYTSNLVLKGPAAEIGVVGRTGLAARDYDQTAKVTGHFSGPLAAAGALAGGPVVGAAVLLFSTVFKGPLSGIVRGYYRITGTWESPKVERIGAGAARDAEAAESGPASGSGR